MTRSPADVRLLVDAAMIAIVPAALVDLALPWWTTLTATPGPGGTTTGTTELVRTGWQALGSSTDGNGWVLLIVLAVSLAALVIDRRWAQLTAVVIGALGALLMLIGTSQLDSEQAHDGVWVGAVLIICCAVDRVWASTLSEARPAPQPAGISR